jgi:hypothetical protein
MPFLPGCGVGIPTGPSDYWQASPKCLGRGVASNRRVEAPAYEGRSGLGKQAGELSHGVQEEDIEGADIGVAAAESKVH